MRISGAVITGVVATLAMGGVLAAFIKNASPYVTVAEAKQSHADGVHLAGDLVKNSIVTDPKSGEIKFKIKDQDGQLADVVYVGSTPGNLSEATKVVAVGGMDPNNVFVSHQLLIKCPSKYESQPGSGPKSTRV
jgi:cytochrome c-type biogenesis protein CcmE